MRPASGKGNVDDTIGIGGKLFTRRKPERQVLRLVRQKMTEHEPVGAVHFGPEHPQRQAFTGDRQIFGTQAKRGGTGMPDRSGDRKVLAEQAHDAFGTDSTGRRLIDGVPMKRATVSVAGWP